MAIMLVALPGEAMAASTAPSKWAGRWSDPDAPGCKREIVMSFDGTKGRLMGAESVGMNPGSLAAQRSCWMRRAVVNNLLAKSCVFCGVCPLFAAKTDFPFSLWVEKLLGLCFRGLTAAEMAREKRVQANKPGCSRGDALKFWEARLSAPGKDSDELTIDLSKSGLPGPKSVQAKWDGSGIVFPDGTKWTRGGGLSGGRGS